MIIRETYSVSLIICRQWPIFPIRRQISIFGTAELNFRVRNGNGWTLCVNITDLLPRQLSEQLSFTNITAWSVCYIRAIAFEVDVFRLRNTSIAQTCTKLHIRMLCAMRQHWPIFPIRRQISIFGTAELNFRVRNGNGWTLCVNNTDLWCTFRDSNPGPTD